MSAPGNVPSMIIKDGARTLYTADVNIGANKLVTANHSLNDLNATYLRLQNAAGNAYTGLYLQYLITTSTISAAADAVGIQANNTDAHYMKFNARDSGVGLVEVARLAGAADPYFQVTLGAVFSPRAQPAAPVKGWLIYNTATDKLNFWNGAAWEVVNSA